VLRLAKFNIMHIMQRIKSLVDRIMSAVITWSRNSLMNVNWNKIKEMFITTNMDFLCDVLSNNNSFFILH